jgi:hypothetical protein
LDKRIGIRTVSAQQLGQPGDIGRDTAGLVACKQIGRCMPARLLLLLKIDIRHRKAVRIFDDEAVIGFLDRPRRGEAWSRTMTPASVLSTIQCDDTNNAQRQRFDMAGSMPAECCGLFCTAAEQGTLVTVDLRHQRSTLLRTSSGATTNV